MSTYDADCVDSFGTVEAGFSVWVYGTQLDWDGKRSRWNESSLLPYWLSRLNPGYDERFDAVVEIWIKQGVVDRVIGDTNEDVIGSNSVISF